MTLQATYAAVIVGVCLQSVAWSECTDLVAPDSIQKLYEERRFLDVVDEANSNEESFGVLMYRGMAQTQRQRYREAHADFSSAYELSPEDPHASYRLGNAELRGFSGTANPERGLALLKAAGAKGCEDAVYAELIYALQSTNYSDVAALHRFEALSESGNASAAFIMGQLYAQGIGVEKNPANAYAHYLRAAEDGQAMAQYEVGNALRWGGGVEKDEAASKTWIAKALSQDERRAHWVRGLELIEQDMLRAAHYEYWRSASAGFLSGQINLAVGHLHGAGVGQDFRQAAYWFHRASAAPLAQQYLGDLYAQGLGVRQDFTKAYEWYDKASGVMPGARAIAAGMLAAGIGVDFDESKAAEYQAALEAETTERALNSMAWNYATHSIPEVRQPEKGLELAKRAYKLEPSWANADTLAAAHAAVGEFSEAIRYSRIALNEDVDALSRPIMETRLEAYEAGRAWIDTYPQIPEEPEKPPSIHPIATFTGEIVSVFQRSGRSPIGYDLEQGDAYFGVVVLVGSVEEGSLPHFMAEQAYFYIHSPTHFFGHLEVRPGLFQSPEGLFRFHLSEVETSWWRHELAFEPLR